MKLSASSVSDLTASPSAWSRADSDRTTTMERVL